jgi:hypothetical protein
VYELSVAAHVAAAVVGCGATFSYPVIQLVIAYRPITPALVALATALALMLTLALITLPRRGGAKAPAHARDRGA